MAKTSFLHEFESGSIAAWAYRVPPAFRVALGVEWQRRVVKGEPVWKWVQTRALRFKEGDLLHHATGKEFVQVRLAAATADHTKDGGLVRWQHGRMENGKFVSEFNSGTQRDFVSLLRDGGLP